MLKYINGKSRTEAINVSYTKNIHGNKFNFQNTRMASPFTGVPSSCYERVM